MEHFIGVKIVTAEPAVKVSGENFKNIIVAEGEPMPLDVTLAVNGYRVTHEGGCTVWMSEEVFEKEFRPTDGMSFGFAIEAAKMGKKITRRGWNGKGQYVELGTCFQYTSHSGDVPKSTCVQHTDIGSAALVFVGTRGRQVGWLASQSDMLADDWRIVE